MQKIKINKLFEEKKAFSTKVPECNRAKDLEGKLVKPSIYFW